MVKPGELAIVNVTGDCAAATPTKRQAAKVSQEVCFILFDCFQ
jgi:hypothetical protein